MDKKKIIWASVAILAGLSILIFWFENIMPMGFNFFSIIWIGGGAIGLILGIKELINAMGQ